MAISQQSVLKFFSGQIEKPAEKRNPLPLTKTALYP
jgi:hypothetical protein